MLARSQPLRTTFTQLNSLRTTSIIAAICYLITPYVNTYVVAPRGAKLAAVRERLRRIPASLTPTIAPPPKNEQPKDVILSRA